MDRINQSAAVAISFDVCANRSGCHHFMFHCAPSGLAPVTWVDLISISSPQVHVSGLRRQYSAEPRPSGDHQRRQCHLPARLRTRGRHAGARWQDTEEVLTASAVTWRRDYELDVTWGGGAERWGGNGDENCCVSQARLGCDRNFGSIER